MAHETGDNEGSPPPQPPVTPAPAHPQTPPPSGNPYGSAPTLPHLQTHASSAPVDHTWDGIPSGYQTELEDLAMQWQQVAGFGITIDQKALRKMADAHVVSLRDLGLWMWNNGGMSDDLKQRSPWLAWGMDQSTFQRQLSDYQDTYEQLTGQRADFDPSTLVGGKQMDMASAYFWQSFQQNLTQSGLRERLLHDDRVQSTYGWVRFGLDFDTFQQRKVDMRMSFGQDLNNDQAVLQLQYLHQTQGSGRAVTAQAPSGQTQGPAAASEVQVR